MEYIGSCPRCLHHLIVHSIRRIKNSTKRKPQKITKCANCRTTDPITRKTSPSATIRATIIGEIIQLADNRHNRLRIHFWE